MIPTRLNLAAHLLDARLVAGQGARAAIRTRSRTFSYADVARLSAQYAHLLAADDIRPEERVIVALPDGPDFAGALFGILRLGSVVVMVNPDAPPDLIQYFLEYSRATAAFVPADRADLFTRVSAGLPRRARLYTVGDVELAARRDTQPDAFVPFDSHRDDAAIWLFSGGTTGRPKGVVQTHRSFANTTALYGHGVLGVREDDVTISVPKLFFGYATGANLFFPFSAGASSVLFPERCTPATLFAEIARHRPTILINVPTMIQQMVSHPEASSQDLSCLRLATSAGEALPAELHERWIQTFGVELLDGLGTAEMWHIFISNQPGASVPGTLGRVVPGFEVKLCDADGNEVGDGEAGVLWVKGESRAIALLAADGRHRARVPRRVVRVRRHAAPQPRWDVHLLRPLRRHAEGERQMGGAGRARELPSDASGGSRSGGRRREDRGRAHETMRIRRDASAVTRACRRTAGICAIQARALQVSARGYLPGRAAADAPWQGGPRCAGETRFIVFRLKPEATGRVRRTGPPVR